MPAIEATDPATPLARGSPHCAPSLTNLSPAGESSTAGTEPLDKCVPPVIVERVVSDVDEIVRLVRFPGWQHTTVGERKVKKALRKTLFKYKLHAEEELFEKAYGYIKQYY